MGNPDKIVAVGLGEVLYDHDVVTDEYTFGGAPANFADHFLKCSRLISGPDAAEVHVVSAVGDDERGRAVSAELEARGLCDGLCRVGELPTGVVDKRRDAAGVNAYEILPGAWDAMTWSDALARLAARTDVVCFGSLAQRSAASHATVVRFLDGVIRRERPTLRVFDVNLRQDFFSREVLEESMARCNILKISDEEAPRVAGCLTGCPAADPGGLCRELLDRRENLEMVILTEGAEGSRVFTRNRLSSVRARAPRRSTRPRRKRNFQGICNVLSDKDRDMETYRYNTLRFFRVQFGLPARMPLEWCVVRETSRAGSELRLGVALKGTGLYIDVAMRRFFSQIDIPLIERRCYPAERISRGDDYEYRSAEGWSFTCPKHYICDIYYPARFSRELLAHSVL